MIVIVVTIIIKIIIILHRYLKTRVHIHYCALVVLHQ